MHKCNAIPLHLSHATCTMNATCNNANHISCKVSWIIIFNTFKLRPFNSICLSHMFQHASIQSTCDSFFMHYNIPNINHIRKDNLVSFTNCGINNAHNNPHSSLKRASNTQNCEHQMPFTRIWLNFRLKDLFIESKNVQIGVWTRKLWSSEVKAADRMDV